MYRLLCRRRLAATAPLSNAQRLQCRALSSGAGSGGAAGAVNAARKPTEIGGPVSLAASTAVPSSAEIVIIGGGVIGCAIAYHLAKRGKRDVLLIERNRLTHGCTWHAAGLLGQLRSSYNLTRMLTYSAQLYNELEKETGQATEWRATGSLRLASSVNRWAELKRAYSTARTFNFPCELLSPKEALDLCPILNLDGVIGAAYIPTDGYAEPSSLTAAFAKGARSRGVKMIQGVTVSGFDIKNRRVTAVKTATGASIACETVVNAAGLWARQVGLLMGVSVPTVNVQHQYLVTQPIPGLPANLPSIRDPDLNVYYKPEMQKLAIGGWEHDSIPAVVGADFKAELYESNFERFGQLAEGASKRTPIIDTVGVDSLINGPIPVSPDGEPIMGRAPELENAYVAAGFTAGIGAAGGAGRMMAEWIVDGAPAFDLWGLDIRRFGPTHNSLEFLQKRTVEVYGHYYSYHPPGVELMSARPARTSPLFQILKKSGAVFGSKFGWERANYFLPTEGAATVAAATSIEYPPAEQMTPGVLDTVYRRPPWFDAVRAEHTAIRERVAIIDMSSFAKLEVWGRNALSALQRVVVGDLNVPIGGVVYTQMCNGTNGGIEADVTIARLESDRFYVVTGSGFGVRDFGWIRDQLSSLKALDGVSMLEVTGAWAVLNLAGPCARHVLAKVVAGGEHDISNAGFPFMTCKSLMLGPSGVPVRALRVTFLGELGWELHVPTEIAVSVYESLMRAGAEFGITNAGYKAIDSCRLEKGYRVWGADLTPATTPYDAGLGFCVKSDKRDATSGEAIEFVGKSILTQSEVKKAAKWRLVTFTIADSHLITQLTRKSDATATATAPAASPAASRAAGGTASPPAAPYVIAGGEAIVHNNTVIGYTSSGGYGYTVGCTIVMGYIPTPLTAASVDPDSFEIEAFGQRMPARRRDPINSSLYDPKRTKILDNHSRI